MDQSSSGVLSPSILQVLLQIEPEVQTSSRVRDNVVVLADARHSGSLAIIIAKNRSQAETIKETLRAHRESKFLKGRTIMCSWAGTGMYTELFDKPIASCRYSLDNGTYKVMITEIMPLWDLLNELQSD